MKVFWVILVIILPVMMLFFNRKVRIIGVLKEQLCVFKNAKTNRISIWDIICFIVFPFSLSAILIFALRIKIPSELAEVLATVFSLVFTVLFGFAAILVGRIESGSVIERQIIQETFISIISTTVLSLIDTVLSIAVFVVNENSASNILWFIIFAISFIIVMFLLMITKRTFVVVVNQNKK